MNERQFFSFGALIRDLVNDEPVVPHFFRILRAGLTAGSGAGR
ncbi:hypothetical protein [Streptomyces sp. NPDC058755]